MLSGARADAVLDRPPLARDPEAVEVLAEVPGRGQQDAPLHRQ